MSKLNPKLFSKDVEQVPIRQGYGEGLLEAGKKDKRVVALCADLTDSTKTSIFSNEFPERFVQMGIAEQSMASVASGFAADGEDSIHRFVCHVFSGKKLGANQNDHLL